MSNDNVSLGLVHEAEVMLRKFGADREFWKKISSNSCLAEKLVNFVETHPVYEPTVVDYNDSLDEMIRKSQVINTDNIRGDRFPIKEAGECTISMVLFNVKDDNMHSPESVIKDGYRPATLAELLTLRMYCPGSSFFYHHKCMVIVARGSIQRRYLNKEKTIYQDYTVGIRIIEDKSYSCAELILIEDNNYNSNYCFAAVRE